MRVTFFLQMALAARFRMLFARSFVCVFVHVCLTSISEAKSWMWDQRNAPESRCDDVCLLFKYLSLYLSHCMRWTSWFEIRVLVEVYANKWFDLIRTRRLQVRNRRAHLLPFPLCLNQWLLLLCAIGVYSHRFSLVNKVNKTVNCENCTRFGCRFAPSAKLEGNKRRSGDRSAEDKKYLCHGCLSSQTIFIQYISAILFE